MDLMAVLHEVESWPVDDRIWLVQEVWDQLVDQGSEPDLTEAQAIEIDRRLAAYKADPENVVPWEEVKAQALARARQ
jgi:putative addiction module component (TIGR02574 family)